MLKLVLSIVSVLLVCVSLSCSHTCLVKSDPPGAHVTVGDEYHCDTPCEVDWTKSRGKIKVVVSKRGYITETKNVKRHVRQLYFVLQPEPTDINQVEQQQEQQMEQQQQMMGPTIVITGGQTVSGQEAVQIKEYGTISFQSTPSGAEVYVENNLIGNTPLSNLKFQAGSYNITVKLPGYKSWVRQIMVMNNGQQSITAALEK